MNDLLSGVVFLDDMLLTTGLVRGLEGLAVTLIYALLAEWDIDLLSAKLLGVLNLKDGVFVALKAGSSFFTLLFLAD